MTTNEEPRPRARIAWWQWLVAVALFAAAGYNYFTAQVPFSPPIFGEAFQPVAIADDFQTADRIEADPGTLAGSNVLLITLDTTRADRIGCYGNDRIQTPHLDRLARQGVIFSQAHATAPTTTPSHSSILTGLYPHHHGVRVNGFYKLADQHVSMAEEFANAGYQTSAFVSAFVLDEQFGLNQGFDTYDDDLSDADAPARYRYKELTADRTTDRALEWLAEADPERPFFSWVHYFDPHAPYDAPEKYKLQSANVYDAEIAFTDAEIGRLLDGLEQAGRLDDTLVVVVADHGESLYQHSEASHAMLIYDASTRIPMILSQPTRLPAKVHLDRRVSQVDLRPTLQTLFGLEPAPSDGVDLTTPPDGLRPVFIETLHPMLTFGWAPLFAVIEGNDKLIYGPGPELYNLATDPAELDNRFSQAPDVVARLTGVLKDEFGDLENVELGQRNVSMSAADLQKLQALGYVGSETVVEAGVERPNPRDMMEAFKRVEAIVYAPGEQPPAEDRITQLEALRKEYPQFVPLLRFLGDAYLEAGDLPQAEATYAEAVRQQPNAPEPAFWLVLSQLRQNKIDEALANCMPILEKYPDYTNAAYIAGALLLQKGEVDQAADQLWSLFERAPDFEQVASVIVDAHQAAKRLPELQQKLEAWVARAPTTVPVRNALANCLMRVEDFETAGQVLREGYELTPDNPLSAAGYAWFQVARPDTTNRRPLEAIKLMEEANTQTGYSDAYLLYVLGICYSQVGRVDEGIAIARKAITAAEAAENIAMRSAATHLLESQEKAKQAGMVPQTPTLWTLEPPADAPGQEDDE